MSVPSLHHSVDLHQIRIKLPNLIVVLVEAPNEEHCGSQHHYDAASGYIFVEFTCGVQNNEFV